jgi:fucose permease
MTPADNVQVEPTVGLRRRRIARTSAPLLFGYATYGAYWGAWAVMFADYLAEHELSLAAAGGLFSLTSITAIATMTLIGGPAVRLPRPAALAGAFALTAAGGMALALAEGAAMPPAFALLGVGIGLVDVLVNLVGSEVEAAARRPVLQLIHAAYGLGGGVAALLTAVAIGRDISVTQVLLTVSALQLVAGVLCWLLVERAPPRASAGSSGLALRVLRGRPDLIAAAVIVLCAFFIEGSMDVWSVLFVRTDLGGEVTTAAAAFAAFAGALTVGRLFAARVLFDLGYERTLVISAAGSVVASVLLVTAGSTAAAGGAFLLLGFFLSVAAPAAFGQVGADTKSSNVAVAAVTTVGYGGFVVGPPALGWIADSLGLRPALGALAVASVGMLASALVGRARVNRWAPR